MELVIQKIVNRTTVDGWYDKDNRLGEPSLVTGEQIGMALEYTNPSKAIQNIHARHKDRLDRLSVTLKLRATDGKEYDTRLYTFKGALEICRWSRQPKADEVMDALYDMADEIQRKGYYSAIPEEQLAEILIANMNDAERLKHVIIPAMRDADVEQIRLMAAYMGLDAKDISMKLFSVSDDNLTAKRMIDNWHKYNLGDYTLADFPEPYNKHPSAMVALDAARRKRDAYGRFAKYCGVVHFNRDGHLSVIEQMQKRRYISLERAEEWIDSLSF